MKNRRITNDKYPSLPELLMMAGYEIVELKRIIAEKDGVRDNEGLDKQILYVDNEYLKK